MTASGAGTSETNATADALQHAVQEVIGTYVSATKALTKQGEIVKEIATFSNGYITTYRMLSCTRDADGVFHVAIFASVARGRLEERLVVENLVAKDVLDRQQESGSRIAIDGKPVYAREVSRRTRITSASELLGKILACAPARAPVKATLVSPDTCIPVKDRDGYSVTIDYTLQCDMLPIIQYNRALDATLQDAHIGLRSKSEYTYTYTAIPSKKRDCEATYWPCGRNDVFIRGGERPEFSADTSHSEEPLFYLLLDCTFEGTNVLRTTWAVYRIEQEVLTRALGIARNRREKVARHTVVIRAVDAAGKSCVERRANGCCSRYSDILDNVMGPPSHLDPFNFLVPGIEGCPIDPRACVEHKGTVWLELCTRVRAVLPLKLEWLPTITSIELVDE
ncbi:MAG: hypothetical protein HY292_18795 [Planctomycetes bacterium]|nr:hypothetical protein [Planctomycetota bacterium]